jgi:hypothetical protein
MVGGLGFTLVLKDSPKATHLPKLSKIPAIPVSAEYININTVDATFLPPGPRYPLDFGAISCGEKSAPEVLERDWAHVGLALSPSLKVYVTRLSPALVLDCAAQRLALFGGSKATPIAYATPKGVFKANQPLTETLGNADKGWPLVWFGKDAALRSTRFPWPGNPNQDCYPKNLMISAVDCPLLLVFERTPVAMQAHGGLTLEAADKAKLGKVVLVPICGDLYPLASETQAWAKDGKLPEAVAANCQWWADHLAEVPMSARERYAYDDKTDTVTISSQTTYLKVREGGERLAPLPLILTIAQEQGFPLRLSAKLVRTTVITALGPYAAIAGTEKYECRLTGLGKYVRESVVVGKAGKEPQELRVRLKEEIDKVIKAGHLAPVFPPLNGHSGQWYNVYGKILAFSVPGETLAVLGQALPLLDKDQREELRAYLKKERADYPPESVAVMPLNVGARQEGWRIDPDQQPKMGSQILFDGQDEVGRRGNVYLRNKLLRPEGLYALAAYNRCVEPMSPEQAREAVQKVLGPYFQHQDWATLGCLEWPGSSIWLGQIDGLNGEMDANFTFTGLVGALRLAYQANDTASLPLLWGQFARAAIRRYALGRYGDFLYQDKVILLPTDPAVTKAQWEAYCCSPAGTEWFHKMLLGYYQQPEWMVRHFRNLTAFSGHLYTFNWTKPEDDVRGVARMSEYGAYFDDTVQPYDALILTPYAGLESPELGRFLAEIEKSRARIVADRVAENLPGWYLTYATATLGAEVNYHHPLIAYHQFLLRAWVLQEPPEKLARYVDIPWMARGDLYYIYKLIETINAYRGTAWTPDNRR